MLAAPLMSNSGCCAMERQKLEGPCGGHDMAVQVLLAAPQSTTQGQLGPGEGQQPWTSYCEKHCEAVR